jgi:glycosyltransferase involved in cell wall biosynthesis
MPITKLFRMRISTTNRGLQPPNRVMFYNDPFYRDEVSSHHSKVFSFIKDILPEEDVLLIAPLHQRFWWTELFKPLKYLFLAFFLLRNSIIVFIEERKSRRFAKVIYFNPNIDPLTLILILGYRRIFQLDFQVRIRFICTVDRILARRNFFIIYFLKLVGRLITASDQISAESLRYARHLSELSGVSIEYLEYPPVDFVPLQQVNKEEYTKIVILFIGNPRKDKGYLDLLQITNSFYKSSEVEFRIQESTDSDREMQEIVEALRRDCNVKILPALPTPIEIAKEVSECDILLLPYSAEMYQFRNSAFMFLGLYFGKRIAAYEGTALYESASEVNLEFKIDNLGTLQKDTRSLVVSNSSLNANLVTDKWRSFLN